ncbi:hypothetical protein [Streptomyces mutabilis]|uniref:hypothetical protein n=1 Tax=Streptomyces mutabilis TaxID=67332 RepID=UPI0017814A2B|nr:hypothetical protein [Streptomyces mutabilis]GGQ11225.1 hypothetical protein GCM10010279_18410 [Streptomyces mutabilis]
METEFAWEQRMSGLGDGVSDRALLGVLALVVAAGARWSSWCAGCGGPRRGGPERQAVVPAAAPGQRGAHVSWGPAVASGMSVGR